MLGSNWHVFRRLSLCVCTISLVVSGWCAESVTLESLLGEMTNLEALTEMPKPAYTCKQFSSYDQKSKNPEVLTDEDWFANGDCGQHLRKETRNGADEWVLADVDGPGAVVRFWSANPNDAGICRIYLDGAEKPAVEMPMTDLMGGETFPFVKPIAHTLARGWNSYLPIPYAKHCKITASKQNFYYQVNYRTYAPGTAVQTFSLNTADSLRDLVNQTAKALAEPLKAAKMPQKDVNEVKYSQTVAPDERVELASIPGPAAIYSLTVKVGETKDMAKALRGCLFEITFDDQKQPAVTAPLGDFFGTAPGINSFQSLPCGVEADGTLVAHWVMPFGKSAVVRLTNHSGAPVRIEGKVVSAKRAWTPETLYFHAGWRQQLDIPTRPRQDWNYVAVEGKGRFVGGMLHVANPVVAWWGEGDEKIYVDGEKFPSHFGTGTEDYYGYAWCDPTPFTNAYHNQPRCDGPQNYGHTCVSRYHIMDNIPFTKSFKFDMEVWHWSECQVSMAETSFWYADAESQDNLNAPEAKDLVVKEIPEKMKVKGAIEGETMRQVEVGGGKVETQTGVIGDWSSFAQLWWQEGKPGQSLTLGFPVEKAGRYEVLAVFTKAKDYGIAQLEVNGKAAGQPMDFYNDNVVATPQQSLGTFDLKEGENLLKATLTGMNPKALDKYMVGLDYVLLKPAQ